MKLHSLSPFVTFLLSPLLVVSPVWAQAASTSSTPAGPPVSVDLQLRVADSDGPNAAVNSSAIKGFTVQVADANGAPVPEVAVALRLPDNGPSGTFADGSRAAVLYTDASGLVRFNRLHWGQTPGPISLRLTAAKGDAHAGLLVSQTLTQPSASAGNSEPAAPPAALAVPALPNTPTAHPSSETKPLGQLALEPPQFAVALPNPAVSNATSAPLPISPAPELRTGASPDNSPAANQLASNTTIAKPEPSVSVTGASPDSAPHHSGKTKWIILGAVAVAAGAGFAATGKKSAATPPSTPSLSIGTPSIAIGH